MVSDHSVLGLLFGEVEAAQLLYPQVRVTKVKNIVSQSQDANFIKLILIGWIWSFLSMVPRIQTAQD